MPRPSSSTMVSTSGASGCASLPVQRPEEGRAAGHGECVHAVRFGGVLRITGGGRVRVGHSHAAGKQEISDYFFEGFRQMLNAHLDDCPRNFGAYMKPQA